GVSERYTAEWLKGQAAGGYVSYDPATERFMLTEEQAFALAAPDGMQVAAAFHLPIAVSKNVDRITEAIRTGSGFGWHEHDQALFEGTERFFRPGYVEQCRSEEHTSELQSRENLVCRLLLEKKKTKSEVETA